ncbi:hypothetical protein KY321_05495 [Candidatus Woesearchaeota archaeon]|nr:hypothetical protein [Candidatus Woesearchaeota archaeon]
MVFLKKSGILVLFLIISILYSTSVFSLVENIPILENTSHKDGLVKDNFQTGLGDATNYLGRNSNAQRIFLDFDTSSLQGSTINSVGLTLTVNSYWSTIGNETSVSVYLLSQKASSFLGGDESQLYAECGGSGSTLIGTNLTDWSSLSGLPQIVTGNLDANAASLLEGNLSNGFFSICIKLDKEDSLAFKEIATFNSGTPSYYPTLVVDYTPGAVSDESPTITSISPTNNSVRNSVPFTLNVSATDDHQL